MTETALLDRLFTEAERVRSQAYAPYSGFQVGAALIAANGALHVGCNVENAAYPVGTCAEAGAIAAMAAAGGRLIAHLAVVGPDSAPCLPCGGCRQRIREFADSRTRIHLRAGPTGIDTMTLEELLPRAFGPDILAAHVRTQP
jgi:cytidine deaminase